MAGEQKAMETNNDEAQVEMRPLRSVLKRRPVSTVSQTPEIIPTSPENNNLSPTVKTIVVKRGPHGLGWHVAGGTDSDPVTGSDRGIFISKVNPNGAAEEAGLMVGDKILTVNGKSLDNLTHNEAVKIIRESGNVVELVVERNEKDEEKELIFKHENPSCNGSMNSLNASTRALPPTIPQTPARKPSSTELIAVTIKRDVDGSPGFSIQGGIAAEPIRISSITPGGAADQTRKLRVGDRILSVNGQNVKFCRQDQVVTMLTGIENEIYLCVEREIKSAEKAKLTPSRSLPLICQEMSSNAIYELIASAYKRPEATTSSVSKSRSTTHLNFIDEKADTIDLLDIERDALGSPKPKPRSLSSQQQEALPTAPPKPPLGRLQLDDLQPRATSTPIPKPIVVQSSSKIPLPAKIPPPVAPKPKVIPETLNFSSKIKKFEEEINAQQSSAAAPTNKIRSVPPPPKKPLVSAQDLKSIKADEEARLAKILAQEESFDEDEIAEKLNAPRITEQPFEHLLNDSPVPLSRPASVRTKKAELRAERAAASEKCNLSFTSTTSSLDSSLQNGELDEASSTLSPLERRALELEKKREWRQARLKSIEAASKHADEVMNEIRQLSRLSNISEDLNSLQPSPIPTT